MRRTPRKSSGYAVLVFLTFAAGTLTGWWIRGGPPQPAVSPDSTISVVDHPEPDAPDDVETASPVPAPPVSEPADSSASQSADAINELARRDLRLPLDDLNIERWKGMFEEGRDRNGRPHEAVDVLAPRNTPVHAVENGTIARLFYSKAGGNTVYEFDPGQRFCYYYAHLERYAEGLMTGKRVARGDIIGYVGTSGNAPANTPHLHFAIFALDSDRHWWQGRPLDPYLVFRRARR
jgi:peptidoglycan LD-endopeptidase LytH